MDYSVKDFGKILKKNHLENRHLLGQGTDCMRVYDRNQEQFPVTVDLYGKYARITDYSDNGLLPETAQKCIQACVSNLYLQPENIILTSRKKREGLAQHEKSNALPVVTHVYEDGLDFEVNLTTYTDTGLFLDQALARRFVREHSAGRSVLNLFSYTGSFSVYAAAGGADSVTSVDLSATYTAWARRNLENNGFSGDGYKCICSDAGSFIEDALACSMHYGIIIFDPPVFSNSRKTEQDFDVQRDWYTWMVRLERLVSNDGFILFSTNLSGFGIKQGKLRLKRADVSDLFRAPGFKKGMKGSVRSWIMAKEESRLTLDWVDDRKRDPEKRQKDGLRQYDYRKNRRDRRYDNGHDERRPRREYSDKKYSDRRSTDNRSAYGRNEYRPRRDRDYNNENRSESRYTYREDSSYQPSRSFRDREYSSGRFSKKRDSLGRTQGEYRSRSEKMPREYDRNGRNERNERSRTPRRDKPYGFDSFRPARGRGDNSKFFWNEDDDRN